MTRKRKAAKKIRRVRDLRPDQKNPNKGTARGRSLLETSVREYGTGRSILIDKKGRVIAGNKTIEAARNAGIREVQVVQVDGGKLIAVQRTDLDLEKDPQARELSIADNRSSEWGLEWDESVLQELAKEDQAAIEKFFSGDQLDRIQGTGVHRDTVVLEQAIQLRPQREYIVVLCDQEHEFDILRERLGLKMVRRGGYKKGSPFDAKGVERVIPAKRLIEEMG